MPDATPTVLIIDDDVELRNSLERLLRSMGLGAQLFASISDFLASDPPDGPTCLVLDVRLPGQSGLDFQRELAAANKELPIIFITGHGDIPMSVQAMKGGAIEFLTKPFRDQDLLDAIQLGLSRDRDRRQNDKAFAALRERFGALIPIRGTSDSLGFPNQPRNDSRWQTEGRLPWGAPSSYGRTIRARRFGCWPSAGRIRPRRGGSWRSRRCSTGRHGRRRRRPAAWTARRCGTG